MPAANDFTLLVDKIERRLGLTIIGKRFPEQFNKDSWVDVMRQKKWFKEECMKDLENA